ncbi:hypothetical protein BJF78_03220 [Pseudonocardia sp. CNS-139]|nr:hypothetical protein BJF78_03220 [Pseudonocardia sp. CNS-139]
MVERQDALVDAVEPQFGGSGWVASVRLRLRRRLGSSGVTRRSSSTPSTPSRLRIRSTWSRRSWAANPAKARSNVTVGRTPSSAATSVATCGERACTT